MCPLFRNWHLYFFIICSPCLSISLVWEYEHLWQHDSCSVLATYTRNLLQGKVGSGYGESTFVVLEPEQLQVGDILLGGYPNCAYGKYSHAGLYMGKGMVVESFYDLGVCIQNVSHYQDYSYVLILRVKAPEESRQKAVSYALKQEGKLFYPLAFKKGDRYWNCTKLIWKAYKQAGIDLDPIDDLWMAPDGFLQSPAVNILDEEGKTCILH